MTFDPAFRTRLLTDWKDGNHTLLVAIAVNIGNSEEPRAAMVDCACGPCVISTEQATKCGWEPGPGLEMAKIHTRFGTFDGVVERFPIIINGADEALGFDCTWLVIDDWPGPIVLGWRGCLERMRFASHPMDNWFYFAEP